MFVFFFLFFIFFKLKDNSVSSVQLLSHIRLFVTPWTTVWQASLSITNSWSLLRLMSINLLMLSNHLILYHPLLFPPSVFPSITVFSNEPVLRIRWPKYWSFSLSISPSNEYSGPISFRKFPLRLTDWISLQSKGLSRDFSNTTVQTSILRTAHCWAYTPRKPELKETCVPQCSSQHCL